MLGHRATELPAGRGDPRTGSPHHLENAYFAYLFSHLLEAAVHMPPAVSQSIFDVYCEKSPLVPDGLADGVVDGEVVEGVADVPDPPGAVLPPPDAPVPVPEPLPDAPEPLPDAPGLPEPPAEPLPPPLPDCAAATTGARAMMPTMMAPTYLRIL